MRNALLIGCGGGNALQISKCCVGNFDIVYNIGSTPLNLPGTETKNFIINWQTFHLNELYNICKQISDVAFIFFNQNGASLSKDDITQYCGTVKTITLVKSWTQSHWISCQMPFVFIQNLQDKFTDDVKIGWMLSGYIDMKQDGVHLHPDYSGNKYTNYLIMKCFNEKYYCFGINPDFESGSTKKFVEEVFQDMKKSNGRVFGFD